MDINERNKLLCDAFANGETMTSISGRTGISNTQLSRIFKAAGVTRKKYELDLAYFEANKQKTKRQISEETGIPHKRVIHLHRIAYQKKLTKGKIDFTDQQPLVDPSLINDATWLREQYITLNKGTPTIAKLLASKTSIVVRQLEKFGIQIRTIKEMGAIKQKRPPRNWLEKHYITDKLSITKCAELYGTGFGAIYEALREFGFEIRDASEQHIGELNSFYGQQHDQETVEHCRKIGAKYGKLYWLTGDVEQKVHEVTQRAKEIWADPQRRLEQSQRITRLCMSGGCNSKQVLYVRDRDNKSFLFRSSWELALASMFEACDIIADWDYEQLAIPIMQADGLKNYIIDFEVKWIDGLTTYVECKNKHLLEQEKEQQKIKQASDFLRKQRSNLIVVDDIKDIENWNNRAIGHIKWLGNVRYQLNKDYLQEPEFVRELIRHHITRRLYGWQAPIYQDDELLNDKKRVYDENLTSYWDGSALRSTAANGHGMPGRAILLHYQPHFLEVCVSTHPMAEAFNDAWVVYRSILQSMEESETLSYERLLREINFHFPRYGRTSHFAPGFARSIIRMFGCSGKRIFDPCCGWGGRLIGAHVEGCQYGGCELSPNSYEGLGKIAKLFGADFNVQNKSCLEVEWPEADLIFTSPPFYDVEKYVGGDQPWKLATRELWREQFVVPFISKIKSKCALYLDEKTRQDFELVRKFDQVIPIKNKRHPRLKDGAELLCVYCGRI